MNNNKMSIIHFPKLTNSAWKYIDCEMNEGNPQIYLSFSLFHFLSEIIIKIKEFSYIWDDIVKQSNEYENILNIESPYNISVYKPVSKLYFKIIEITQSLKFCFRESKTDNFVMFSFSSNMFDAIEPIYNLRKNPKDNYYGFYSQNNREEPNIHILDISTYLSTKQHQNTADLIYCDGGNDSDPEHLKIDELFFQISNAVCVQAHKGSLIVKLSECFHKTTTDIIFILSSMYEKTYITKPNIADQLSAERFLICNNFLFSNYKEYYHIFEKTSNILKTRNKEEKNVSSLLKTHIPMFFKNKMDECNTIIGQQQLEKIYNIFGIIENRKDHQIDFLKNNIKSSILWCEKNGVEYIRPDDNEDNKRPNIFRQNIV
jgi:hypothetical protein